MKVYQRIRDLREDADLFQEDVARILGCPPRTYGDYELGQTDIPVDRLICLAKFYQTTTDHLLGLTRVREQPNNWKSSPQLRIRGLRKAAGFTQAKLAKAIHCSQNNYCNYELENRKIPTKVLISLAQLHNTTTDYLLGLSDEREKPE